MNLQENIHRIKEVMGLLNEESFSEDIGSIFRNLIDKFKSTKIFNMDTDIIKKIQSILGMEVNGNIKDLGSIECIKQFQNFADITPDGIVGPVTLGKIKEFNDGVLTGWKGCKKSSSSSSSSVGSSVVGSGWKSCKSWRNKGGIGFWRKNFDIDESSDKFVIRYKGPSSGLSIAHAANGGDTIHQVYNVLICEINPFLAKNKLKPLINEIQINGSKEGKLSKLTISVPLEDSDKTYQLDRRGGWNHDPGPSKMSQKCKSVNSKGGECEGPIKNIVQGGFGKITEYFITHTI
jgi:hypothetical protein